MAATADGHIPVSIYVMNVALGVILVLRCVECSKEILRREIRAEELTQLTRTWRYGDHTEDHYCSGCSELGQLILELPN